MPWAVEFHAKLAAEFAGFAEVVQDELLAHTKLLAEVGPSLGRPTVDTLKGGKIANLKELRFMADGGVWRVAFALDRDRVAVLLAAGDKRGKVEARFYKSLIATAERRFADRADV
ncbi:MAG: type II toxin-antitoxin system RelE/ParE family toxin [Acetobacteraceae bacterium]